MTRRVLSNKKLKCACGLSRAQFPDWLKLSYAQWIRYAYDQKPHR